MKKASKATIANAVEFAKKHKIHVIVGWPQFASLRGPARGYECKNWPSKRIQNQYRDIDCIVRPDGTVFTF